MQPVAVHPGLAHRLLVAAARAHYLGVTPCDWQDLAAGIETSASPRAIQRALAHLAEDGLIEGICTPAGWLSVRPTPRGLGRAGRAVAAAVAASTHAPVDGHIATSHTLADRVRETADEANRELHLVGGYLAARKQDISPRLGSLRSTVAQAWHTLTTLP